MPKDCRKSKPSVVPPTCGWTCCQRTCSRRYGSVSGSTYIAVVVSIILDLEFPRLGLLQVKTFDQALEALLQSIK